MKVSTRTMGLLAKEFEGGGGALSHSAIDGIWMTAGADRYLPPQKDLNGGSNNKQIRVLTGLKRLNAGYSTRATVLDRNPEALNEIVQELANGLNLDLTDGSSLSRSLLADGMTTDNSGFLSAEGEDSPTRRLADHLLKTLEAEDRFKIARNHYVQGLDAFDRGAWESANGDFRSAYEAVFNELAHAKGCPASSTGGKARKWLGDNGHIDDGEADLLKSFGLFSHSAGAHPGLSDKSECQLRRHMVTALMTYGISKLG